MGITSITRKENEYLAILYEYLENGLSRVTTTELASKTYVTLGAVSSILKKLDNKLIEGNKLINYMKGYGVALSQTGQKIAGKLVRRRRIGELFLNHLGFNFYSIQKQIYQVNITDEISDKIENKYFMDNSEIRCSHGYLIPDNKGIYQFEQFKSLNQFNTDSKVKIIKIPESPFYYIPEYTPLETNYFLNIYNNNLMPGNTIKIVSNDPNFVIIETKSGNAQIPISGIGNQIYVMETE